MLLKRNEYPVGVPCWIDRAQPDPVAAVRFYGELFGWEFENVMPADSPRPYFIASLDGLDVAGVSPLEDETAPTPSGAPTSVSKARTGPRRRQRRPEAAWPRRR